MASPIISGIGNLTNIANTVASTAQAMAALGNVANMRDLWPVQNWGDPKRLPLAGVPNLESNFHYPFEQGRFLERPVGDAIAAIQTKQLDLREKILTYVNLHKVALDSQLSDTPRVFALTGDSITLVQQIRTYVNNGLALLSALQANMQVLLAAEARMTALIQANVNALANLIQEVCNWNLPDLPSLAAQLGGFAHWNGFNFNLPSGFNFDPNMTMLGLNLNFAFSSCVPRTADLASVFGGPPASVSIGDVTARLLVPQPPLNGVLGDPARLTDPKYISEMQATNAPVYNPEALAAAAASTEPGTSLPNPGAIISNYSLPADTYVENICSAVSSLRPLVIQPDDPNYVSGKPSASVLANLRAILIQYVNLETIVASGYDANLVAAWLIYLSLNRNGRSGQWLPAFQGEYTDTILPSINYVENTPVPWNDVLGGSGVSAAPTAIPLIDLLKADATNNLKWRLSHIEASLLGYPRSRAWDTAADTTFLAAFTGSDLDYARTAIEFANTATLALGVGTASFPVEATLPVAIASVLNEVIVLAATDIQAATKYQSPRPQFRFTYDMFAAPKQVDRFSQFWRDFNAGLNTLLAQPDLAAIVCSYTGALNSAINPLASNADYMAVQTDLASRNLAWTPGSALPSVPVATVLTGESTAPTALTNGWSTGTLDSAAFLTRPDIQAQSLPVQIAMLRTNQSFATLMTLKNNVQNSVQSAIANAQAVAATIGIPGWEVEADTTQTVSPATPVTLTFAVVDLDTGGYVTSKTDITAKASGVFIVNVVVNWDTAGAAGTRTVTLLQNGVAVFTNSTTDTSSNPYLTQFSTALNLAVGDVLKVQAGHNCATVQTVLSGRSFLGLQDPGGTVAVTGSSETNSSSGGSIITPVAGAALAAATAVSIQANGKVLAVNPNMATLGVVPFVDGITLESTVSGQQVSVGTGYGQVYTIPGMHFTVGGLIYVNADGTLTQDYTAVTQTLRWVICVGKATAADQFMYQPHLPTNYIQNW